MVLEIWAVKNFFKTFKFLWNCMCVTRTIWAVACVPMGPTLLTIETGGRGVKVGGQAPKLKILNFWTDTLVLYFGPHFFLHCDSRGDGSKHVNWKKVLSPNNPHKMGFEIFMGAWHFFGFPPQGAVPPIRPVLITPRSTPVFKWGNCPHGCL